MKEVIIQDLYKHYREKATKQVEDIIDTCRRISDSEDEALCAASYIVIRSLLSVVAAMCVKHGASKEEYLEMVASYWDNMYRAHQKWEAKND